ncbi:MAG: hypothetical protein HOB79_21350 [Rhodospirillaceae bacterium]|jgi:hypothetical protein|nr:hypothetical protein [Rhodospirillaceae bacterium]MBT4703627.1 hypothetical protein [Rhodospirillaceae bacterium]MBT5034590.1 hypothetical protein [Rhodospirillaceae bacterium]MBT6221179.1 hypothetical protein [Rhodospirillaceae bacterium]MBT6364161.1 hypothetical protein [Rhodospirillaceae bacterium]
MANISKKDELPLSTQPGASLLKVPVSQAAPQSSEASPNESAMSLFVHNPKAHRRALAPKQVPAPEQTLTPEPVVEPAPITVPKSSDQPSLAKPKVTPAPVTKPSQKPSTEQRQSQIQDNFNGYSPIKPPKKTPLETGEQIRQRVMNLPTNDKAKTIEGFTAKQKMLLHEATRAAARRAPDAPNPANQRLRDRSGILKNTAIESGKAAARGSLGTVALVINAPSDALKRSAATLNTLSSNILGAGKLPKSGQIRIQRQISSLFRDIDSGNKLGHTIDGYKKYLKSGDIKDFPADVAKLAATLNARSAGFEESEIVQIVRNVEKQLKAKDETLLTNIIEGTFSGGRSFFTKFAAKQAKLSAAKIATKAATGKNLSAREQATLGVNTALRAKEKAAKAAAAIANPLKPIGNVAKKKAAEGLTDIAAKLTPKVLRDKLPEGLKKRAKKSFGQESEKILENLAKQFIARQKGGESPDTTEGVGKATYESLVKRALQNATKLTNNRR